MLSTFRDEDKAAGVPEDRVQKLYANGKALILWALIWLLTEDKYIKNWYHAAFEKYGRSARITDMMRTGKVWCNCSNCDGKVRQRGEPHASMNPALFTPKGYVNINAIMG